MATLEELEQRKRIIQKQRELAALRQQQEYQPPAVEQPPQEMVDTYVAGGGGLRVERRPAPERPGGIVQPPTEEEEKYIQRERAARDRFNRIQEYYKQGRISKEQVTALLSPERYYDPMPQSEPDGPQEVRGATQLEEATGQEMEKQRRKWAEYRNQQRVDEYNNEITLDRTIEKLSEISGRMTPKQITIQMGLYNQKDWDEVDAKLKNNWAYKLYSGAEGALKYFMPFVGQALFVADAMQSVVTEAEANGEDVPTTLDQLYGIPKTLYRAVEPILKNPRAAWRDDPASVAFAGLMLAGAWKSRGKVAATVSTISAPLRNALENSLDAISKMADKKNMSRSAQRIVEKVGKGIRVTPKEINQASADMMAQRSELGAQEAARAEKTYKTTKKREAVEQEMVVDAFEKENIADYERIKQEFEDARKTDTKVETPRKEVGVVKEEGGGIRLRQPDNVEVPQKRVEPVREVVKPPLPEVLSSKGELTKEPWMMTKKKFESGKDIIYHGGKGEYPISSAHGMTSTGNPTAKLGAFFTPSILEAQRYVKDFHGGKGTVQLAKVMLKKPYKMPFKEFDKLIGVDWKKMSFPEGMAELENRVNSLKKDLIARGYDGIIIGDKGKFRAQEIVAFNDSSIIQHRYAVEKALRESKPVPPEVLKDYPDLMPKGVSTEPIKEAKGKGIQTKIVSEETGKAATARIKERLSKAIKNPNTKLYSGIPIPEWLDVQMIKDLTLAGLYHLERGARTFAEWTKAMVKEHGENVRPALEYIWGEVGKARAGQIGKPELANISKETGTRSVLNVIDEANKRLGKPDTRDWETVFQEADAILQDRYKETYKHLETYDRPLTDIETVMAKKLLDTELAEAAKTGDAARRNRAEAFADKYREQGTLVGRAMAIRRDPYMSPEQRRAAYLDEAMEDFYQGLKERQANRQLTRDEFRQKLEKLGYTEEQIQLAKTDPSLMIRMLNDIQTHFKADWLDKSLEYWRNSILSSLQTGIVNAISTPIRYILSKKIRKPVEALLNSAFFHDPRAATLGEYGRAKVAAEMPAMADAARNFFMTFDLETPTLERAVTGKGDMAGKYEGNIAISGKKGRIIRLPQRGMSSVDEFHKSWMTKNNVADHAYRNAKSSVYSSERGWLAWDKFLKLDEPVRAKICEENGVKGDVSKLSPSQQLRQIYKNKKRPMMESEELYEYMQDQVMNIGSKSWSDAFGVSKELAFQSEVGHLGKVALYGMSGKYARGFRFLIPFVTTPYNIFKAGLRYTPFATPKYLLDFYRAAKTGDFSKIPEAASRQAIGYGTFALLAYTNTPENKWITGYNEDNYQDRTKIRMFGKQFDYGYIEPVSTMLGGLVDISDAFRNITLESVPAKTYNAISRQIQGKTWMKVIGDIFRGMEEARRGDEGAFTKNVSDFVVTWMPFSGFVRSTGRALQQGEQDRSMGGNAGFLERVAQKTEILPALGLISSADRYDIWGEPIDRFRQFTPQTDFFYKLLVPVSVQNQQFQGSRIITVWNAEHDKGTFGETLPESKGGGINYDGKLSVRPPDRSIERGGKKYDLTDTEYAELVRFGGQWAKDCVNEYIRTGKCERAGYYTARTVDPAKPNKDDIIRIKTILLKGQAKARNEYLKNRAK